MDAVVSANGVTVPKRMLRGVTRVLIQKKQGVIVITPQKLDDPLLSLGSAPSRQSLSQGARNHDKYIYRDRYTRLQTEALTEGSTEIVDGNLLDPA